MASARIEGNSGIGGDSGIDDEEIAGMDGGEPRSAKKKTAKEPATSRSAAGKNPNRVAAGKKRFRALVRKLGSKEAALEYLFGGKKGKSADSVNPRSKAAAHRRLIQQRLMRNEAFVLREIQKKNGTEGLPATAVEQRLAKVIVIRNSRASRPADPVDPEAAKQQEFQKRILAEAEQEARRRVAARLEAERRQQEAEARKKAEAEEKRQIEEELRNLSSSMVVGQPPIPAPSAPPAP